MSDPRRNFFETVEAHEARIGGPGCVECDGRGDIDPVAYAATWDEPGGYYCAPCDVCDGTGVAR